jgi:hypothetical protein
MRREGRDAYDKMKPNFDKKALLRLIRHNYLYHYPNDKNVERAFEAIPADEPWEWYFSEANTNSFYFSCELILGYGLRRADPDRSVRRGDGESDGACQHDAGSSDGSHRSHHGDDHRCSGTRRVLGSLFRGDGPLMFPHMH